MSIKDGNVKVKAPRRVSEQEIENLIAKKAKWIQKHVEETKQKTKRPELYSQEEFVKIIQNNVTQLIAVTGLKPNRVRIRTISYAWGSCSSKKNITLNSKLISYEEPVIRYVILHELCHLQHMNHSQAFWKLVEQYMPDYKEVKKQLKQ